MFVKSWIEMKQKRDKYVADRIAETEAAFAAVGDDSSFNLSEVEKDLEEYNEVWQCFKPLADNFHFLFKSKFSADY